HRFRCFIGSQHHLDFSTEHLLVILESRLAIAVVEQVGIKHRLLLGLSDYEPSTSWMRDRVAAYCSATFFRFASPVSKSLPIMLSMFMNTCMTLDMKGAGPCITQVTSVAPPCGSIVNSAVL